MVQGRTAKRELRSDEIYQENIPRPTRPKVSETVLGIKKSMTKAQFDQEFLCKPISSNALFSNIDECVVETINTEYERVYIGMDIGVAQDYTVLTAMDENYNIIDIDRFNYKEEGMDNDEFKQRIKDFYLRYDEMLSAAYFEVNNNDLLFDELTEDDRLYKMIPFTTSAENKAANREEPHQTIR